VIPPTAAVAGCRSASACWGCTDFWCSGPGLLEVPCLFFSAKTALVGCSPRCSPACCPMLYRLDFPVSDPHGGASYPWWAVPESSGWTPRDHRHAPGCRPAVCFSPCGSCFALQLLNLLHPESSGQAALPPIRPPEQAAAARAATRPSSRLAFDHVATLSVALAPAGIAPARRPPPGSRSVASSALRSATGPAQPA